MLYQVKETSAGKIYIIKFISLKEFNGISLEELEIRKNQNVRAQIPG